MRYAARVGNERDERGEAYGTAEPDAPVARADFERAIRSLHMSDVELRDAMLQLGPVDREVQIAQADVEQLLVGQR